MFFFSGFSTILPYAVYLSLIWICILIGFRGKLLPWHANEQVSAHDMQHQVTIDHAEYNILKYKCDINKADKKFIDHALKFCEIFEYSYSLFSFNQIKIFSQGDLISFSLRGPPMNLS
ncbi:MAG: hypothetical protein JW894_09405 [Bacteroidales bacterium]|nr:hypothetical protein [Bacteroidales bacterium]